MAGQILPNMLDYEIAEETQEELIKSGIHLHLKSGVTEIAGQRYIEKTKVVSYRVMKLRTF